MDTCHTGSGSSTVDFVLSRDGCQVLHHDATTMRDHTDHAILHIALPVAVAPPPTPDAPTPAGPVTYRWDVGTSVQQQQTGIARWAEHTGREEFRRGMARVTGDDSMSNEARSAAMEQYLLQEGQAAGVVSAHTPRAPINPNRWGKHLAPWFNAACHVAKRQYKETCKSRGKGDELAKEHLRSYQKTCEEAKRKYTEDLPDMLKYRPVEFWRLLKRGK